MVRDDLRRNQHEAVSLAVDRLRRCGKFGDGVS